MFGLEEAVVGVVLGLLSPPTSPLADISVKTSVSSVVVTSTPLSPSEPLRVLGGSDLWLASRFCSSMLLCGREEQVKEEEGKRGGRKDNEEIERELHGRKTVRGNAID